MISIAGLVVELGGIRALDGLTVDLEAPLQGLIGPNGAGKTTLLNALSGLVPISGGTIEVDGIDLSSVKPTARARWGLRRTFQTTHLAGDLTVRDNIAVAADHTGMTTHERSRAVTEACELTELESHAHQPVSELPTALRIRVELARASVGRPRLVLLDEPAAGLGDHETTELVAMTKRVADHLGAQIVVIDHDMTMIRGLCEEVAVLDYGRLIVNGPTESVLTHPDVHLVYLGGGNV